MLTTDPGTPGNNHWEINTSLNFHFAVLSGIQLPATEIVYGIGSHFQLSTQLPMPNLDLNKSHFTALSQPQAGMKYRILDEEENFVSLSVYPQIILPIKRRQDLQVFLPFEFEKTIGSFCIGEEFGYFVLNNPNVFFNGTLIGFRFENNIELMGEFYVTAVLNTPHSTSGLLNIGMRKELNNKHVVMMAQVGTELLTPLNEDRQSLVGLLGIQILL